MKRSAQTAPAPKSAQDVSSELLKIEQSIAEGTADGAAALQAISAALASVPVVSGACIALYRGRQITCVASAGTAPRLGEPILADGLIGECLQTGRLIRCQHASDDSRVDPILRNQYGFESLIVVPVQSRSSASGVLAVFSAQPDVLDQEYVFVLGSAAHLAALIAVRLPAIDEYQTPIEDTVAAKGQPPSSLEALSAAAPGSSIDLTALSLSDLVPPVPTPAPDMQELLTSLPKPVSVAKKSWPSPAVRYTALVVFGLMAFSTALYPAIRGRQTQATPKAVAKSVVPLQGSTDETIGRPTRVVAAPRATSSIVGGELRRRTAPEYPQNALRNGMQGEVNLILAVDEAGVVTDTRVLSGLPDLANAATSAVSHWRFAPFMADGRPVPVNLPVVIAFHCSGTEESTCVQASLPPSSGRQVR